MAQASTEAIQAFESMPASAKTRIEVVAALYSVSKQTIRRWAKRGAIPQPTTVGGVALWNIGELRTALGARRQ